MTNFLAPITGIAALGAALAIGISQEPSPVEPIETAEPLINFHSKVWTLANNRTQEVCLITKKDQISKQTAILDPDPTCQNVFHDGDQIRSWQQDQLGNIGLTDSQGNIIAEFAVLDDTGLVSISVEPGQLMLIPNS